MENIRPIKTEQDYEWALAEVAAFFDNPPPPGSAGADRFDVLSDLIEAWENKHHAIEAPDPVSAIKAYMVMSGLGQADLAAVLGSRSRASEVLNRRRALTLEMIHKLNAAWHIPAEILIKPYQTERVA